MTQRSMIMCSEVRANGMNGSAVVLFIRDHGYGITLGV